MLIELSGLNRMRRADYGPGWVKKRGVRGVCGFVSNVIIILIGIFMLAVGTYVSFTTEPELQR